MSIYKRNIYKELLIYISTFVLLAITIAIIIATKKFEYLFFVLTIWILRDFVFPVSLLSISDKQIFHKRYYLCGLIQAKTIIDLSHITHLRSVSVNVANDDENESWYFLLPRIFSLFSFLQSNSYYATKGIYQINYHTNISPDKKCRFLLSDQEVFIIKKHMQQNSVSSS